MKPNALKAMIDSYNSEIVYRNAANAAKTNKEWDRFIDLASEEADKQMAMAVIIAEYEGVTVDAVFEVVIDEWEKAAK